MTGVTLDDQGDNIARMLDRLGRGPAVILGHAYGNFIARVLATNHPEKVSAVILAALDPFHRKEEWADLRSELGLRVTTTVIEGASHALFPEQAAAVAHAVIGYLKTLPHTEPDK
jgi:predicted alpha/beta-hydrolase family hydrolase